MSLDADALIDRRRLKRRLALWRTLAILALVTVVVVGFDRVSGFPGAAEKRHVARFTLSGLITDESIPLSEAERTDLEDEVLNEDIDQLVYSHRRTVLRNTLVGYFFRFSTMSAPFLESKAVGRGSALKVVFGASPGFVSPGLISTFFVSPDPPAVQVAEEVFDLID